MSKGLKITLWIILAVIVILGIAILIYFFGDNYDEFYERTEEEFNIPGIEDGFTQQGLTYLENENLFVFSGYMNDETLPSRIYIVNGEQNEVVKYFTLKVDNKDYFGHCGGIATDGVNMWVATTDDLVYRFSVNDALEVENASSVNVIDGFNPNNSADFCNVTNGILWVGEFYREGNYETNSSHYFTTIDGSQNKAIISAFEINSDKQYGVESTTPIQILSVGNLVQGMTISNSGKIVLSTSYSIPNSQILIYENVLENENDTTMKINEVDVPVWYLDSTVLEESISGPCMAEEIVYVDGKVYISFESACKKYSAVVRENVDHVRSFELA